MGQLCIITIIVIELLYTRALSSVHQTQGRWRDAFYVLVFSKDTIQYSAMQCNNAIWVRLCSLFLSLSILPENFIRSGGKKRRAGFRNSGTVG